MDKYVKTLLYGLIIWTIPFVTSLFLWDIEANAPSVSAQWFSAAMTLTLAIGIAIASYLQFKGMKKETAEAGLVTGSFWFAELVFLDLIVLVGILSMSLGDLYPIVVSYLSVLVIPVAIGYIMKK